MTDTELIDALTKFWLNVGEQETADDAEVQDRNAFFAQQAVSRFWHWKPWPWKQRTDTTTVTNGAGDLPDDFGAIGQQGGVFISTQGHKLRWRPVEVVITLQERQQTTSGIPYLYALTDLSVTAPGTARIKVFPKANATLRLYYDAKAPAVSYGGDGLESIPAQYHETVLFDFAASKLAFGEGDPRAIELEQRAQRAMAEAWAEERPGVNQPRRGPAYGRARYYA